MSVEMLVLEILNKLFCRTCTLIPLYIPFTTLDNGRITEGLVNNIPCRGLHIKVKDECHIEKIIVKGIW